jgi:Ca-activated chloride channel family protein
LQYSLLTRYTSLVAVDKTPRRGQGDALASENIPSLLPAGNTMASGFTGTATGWKTQLLLSFITFFAAAGMLLYRPPSRDANAGSARSPMTALEN